MPCLSQPSSTDLVDTELGRLVDVAMDHCRDHADDEAAIDHRDHHVMAGRVQPGGGAGRVDRLIEDIGRDVIQQTDTVPPHRHDLDWHPHPLHNSPSMASSARSDSGISASASDRSGGASAGAR